MELSIAIVNWNTRGFLHNCLASIYGTLEGLQYEVVVVDNGSTDGSVEMVARDFAGTTLICNAHNHGFARANNQAIRASTGRYVLLLNSDAVLVGDGVRRMVEFLDTRPETAAVGGKLLNPDGTFQGSFADFPSLLGETLLLTGLSRWLLPKTYPSYPEAQSGARRAVDWVSGAFLLVRRQALDSVGLLDEDYFMYTEETDWCYRMKQCGWSVVYLPEAQALHRGGGSSDRAPERKRAQLYRSKWLFFRKHRGWLTAAMYRHLVRVVSAVKLVVWLSTGLSPKAEWRERAHRNVGSYRFLLANF